MINKISKLFYSGGRKSRDLNAVVRAFKTGSPMPIIKRIWNKFVGRKIVSKLFWR